MIAFDKEVEWILGRPNFTCIGIANRLRSKGQEIKTHAEEEQAAVIYWMLCLYEKHGEKWKEEGDKLLKPSPEELEEAKKQQPTQKAQNR